jgi:hypothetical protein
MRVNNRWLVALLAAFLAAPAARAGTLTSATWTTDALGVPLVRPVLGAGSSTATSVSVSLTVPQFTTTFFLPKTPSGVTLHVKLSQGGAAHLTASPSMAAADAGIPGTVVVMTAMHVAMGVNASMFVAGGQSLFHVPLDVGGTGHFDYSTAIVSGIPITVAVDYLGWTDRTRTFTGLSLNGAPIPDVVAMGSFALTPMGGGSVLLVAPTRISVDFPATFLQRNSVSLTTLKLTFVPEPSALWLLGVCALALARRPRASKRKTLA